MDHERLTIWLYYEFFVIKKKAQKVCCNQIEISDDGIYGEKKTTNYFYHLLEGYAFSLSPAFQVFSFVSDESLSKFGVSLKSKKFSFFFGTRIEILRTAGNRVALPCHKMT